MSISSFCIEQRDKEERSRMYWIGGGLVASALIHAAIAYNLPFPWSQPPERVEDPIEIIVVEEPEVPIPPPEEQPEPEPPPEPEAVTPPPPTDLPQPTVQEPQQVEPTVPETVFEPPEPIAQAPEPPPPEPEAAPPRTAPSSPAFQNRPRRPQIVPSAAPVPDRTRTRADRSGNPGSTINRLPLPSSPWLLRPFLHLKKDFPETC
ncbi:MAG: hypothetical protein LRZ84_05210 [Desertifilum sp.]|nr:hypothetical protein [Desertifilum sp.]